MVISNFADVEKRISEKISEIRKIFPKKENYYFSIDNPVAQYLEIGIREANQISCDGLYIPGKKIIIINTDITYDERKNFSLFHEITHYLISIDDDINSFLMQYHAGKDREYQKYIEGLCNFGAGEFLSPINEIREYINTKKFSIELIKELDKNFPASKPAILFQLARTANHKCTLLIIDRRKITHFNQPKKLSSQINHQQVFEYYILYSATSKSNKYRPGRYTIIPKHHLLRTAFEEHSFIKGEDYIPYASGNKNHYCYCEAMYYSGKVFGLFNLENPINESLQPKLF